jgi:hypothetical protein
MKNITGCCDVPHAASPPTKKSTADDQNGPCARVVLISPLSLEPGVSYQLASPLADPDDCFANI